MQFSIQVTQFTVGLDSSDRMSDLRIVLPTLINQDENAIGREKVSKTKYRSEQ